MSIKLYIPALIFLAGMICFSAIQHYTIKPRRSQRPVHLLFASISLAVTLFTLSNAQLFLTTTITDYIPTLRLNITFAVLIFALLPWFFAEYAEVRPTPVLIGFTGLCSLLFVVNLTQPYTLLYKEIHGITQLTLPWGEAIFLPQTTNSIWGYTGLATVILSQIFGLYALGRCFHRDRKRTTLVMLFAVSLLLAATIQGSLVRMGILHLPPLGPFGFLCMTFIMELALSHEIHEERRHLQAILDHVPAHIFMKDTQGRYLMINHYYEKIFHISAAAVYGKTDYDLFPRKEAEAFHAGDQQVLTTRCPLKREEIVILDEEPHTYLSIKVPLFHTNGTPFAVCGIATDITERKKMEEALRESERKVRAIFDLSFEFIGLLTPDGILLDANKTALDFAGVQLSDVVGKPFWETPWWSHSPEMQARIRSAVENAAKGTLVREEAIHPAHDGSLHSIDFTLKPVKDETGKITLLIPEGRDITENKQAELKQLRLQNQLAQAQKLESVGRLAGGVAHDFNNMLGVIIGHSEIALAQLDSAQPLHASLMEIYKAASRSADLTRQLLAFARKQTIAPKVLDLNKTVEGMLNMLHRLIGEDINLNWQPDANLWPVKIDPSQVDQILANLCINARDAITDIGKITIKTSNNTFNKDYCAIHTDVVPGEYVQLAISDTGHGMDKVTLAHIFEPFFTTKDIGKGTGLGLATVYGAVKQNNGFVKVYSEPEQGTTFTIYLPRHVGSNLQIQAGQPTEPALGGQETILLVEDDPAILQMVKMMLTELGYTLLSSSTPGEAISQAQEYAGEIHLLVTDVIMPEMNGLDLAENLLSLYPHLKRLFMSGYTADIIAHHGVLDEGVHFIQKPFSIKDLATKIREALEQS